MMYKARVDILEAQRLLALLADVVETLGFDEPAGTLRIAATMPVTPEDP